MQRGQQRGLLFGNLVFLSRCHTLQTIGNLTEDIHVSFVLLSYLSQYRGEDLQFLGIALVWVLYLLLLALESVSLCLLLLFVGWLGPALLLSSSFLLLSLDLSSPHLLMFLFSYVEVFHLLFELNFKFLGQVLHNQHVLRRAINWLSHGTALMMHTLLHPCNLLSMKILTWRWKRNQLVIWIALMLEYVIIINVLPWKVHDISISSVCIICIIILVAILIRLMWNGSIISITGTSGLSTPAGITLSTDWCIGFLQLKISTRHGSAWGIVQALQILLLLLIKIEAIFGISIIGIWNQSNCLKLIVLLDRASSIHYGAQVNTLSNLRWHLASTTSSTCLLLHQFWHVLWWSHQVLFKAYLWVAWRSTMLRKGINLSSIIIGRIAHALSTLSPSASSIFLTLIDHAIIQSRVVQLAIHILLMHPKLSLSLRPHLFNFLHRDVLLNALTCASIIPFIHVWIPIWTIVVLLIKCTASNCIYWIVNILILKCDGASSVSIIDQLTRGRVAEARTDSLMVWCATSCARALRWIFVLLHPLVLLMDQILLVGGTACVVGVTNCVENLWLALLALDVDIVWCIDCLQILKVAFLVWVRIVILIVDLAKLLISVTSFWRLCPALRVICHKDILFVGLAHKLAIDSRGWHDLLRGLGSSDIWILHKTLVCVIDPTNGVVTASELVGILNHHLLLV